MPPELQSTQGLESAILAVAEAISRKNSVGGSIHLKRSSGLSLPATSSTNATGLSVITNDGDYVYTSSSITIPEDGIYLIIGNGVFNSINIRADFVINSTVAAASISQPYGKVSASSVQRMAAGDNITITITNNSAAAASIDSINLQVIRMA